VARGNTVYPAVIAERTDTDLTYNLQSFQVKPLRLGWSDLQQLTYDKMNSVMNDAMGGLDEAIKNWALSQWWTHNSGAADRIVDTSGTATAKNWLSGGTGAPKVIKGVDVRNCAKILDKEKFPATDRSLILDYEQFWQLLGDVSYNDARLEIIGGLSATLDNIYGFKVYQLPYVAAVSANTGTVTPIEPAAATGAFTFTANNRPIGLAFHKSAVSFAWTINKVFVENDKADYYGSIISAEIFGGGKYRRTDGKGVVALRSTV
jgi:hypothetical protein